MVHQPYGLDARGGQAHIVDNFITIRVFLKVIDDINNEHLKKLFMNTNPNTDAAAPETQNMN